MPITAESLPPRLQGIYSHLRGFSLENAVRELDNEIARRKETQRIAFFEPNGVQEKAINLFGNGLDMVGIVSTSNGLGKTSLVVNIIGNLVFGPQTPYFDKPLFLNWPYPKRIRYITNPKLVEEIGPFHSEILKWWPQAKYESVKAGKSYYSQYKANGWVVDVMTYEQAVTEFEGVTAGAIFMDEPPKKPIFHACMLRLRLGGLLFVFMTPLTEAAWFFDEVVPRHQDRIIYGDIEDNCKQHGIRGQLEHDVIQKMIDEMDPDEVEARAHGKAMYLRGLIYKTFDRSVHVAKCEIPVPSGAQVWQIVDPHIDKPFACIWGYPERDGTFSIVDEYPNEDFYKMHGCKLGLEDYVKIFRHKEQGWRVTKRIMDRHFSEIRSVQTKHTLRDDFQKVGFIYEPSYQALEEVSTGIIKVKTYLNYNTKKPIDNLNRPKLIISPKCKNTIKGFERWSLDPKTGEPLDAYKDFVDDVRYALMSDPKVSEMPSMKESKRLFA